MTIDVLSLADEDDAREAREAQWLGDVASGGTRGQDAWGRLFRAYRPRILKLFGRFRLSGAAREDLVHDVMLTLHDKASQFEPGNLAWPWVRRIALNKLFDWFNRHDQSKVVPLVDEEPPVRLHAGSIAASSVPEDVVAACRRRQWRVFATARPRAALALQLCHAEGWTIAELAEFLGMTEGSTKGFLHIERQHARTALEPCEPGQRTSKVRP